jgi:hypothetical protein
MNADIAKCERKIAGCPVFEAGGKLCVATAPIRRVLGLDT